MRRTHAKRARFGAGAAVLMLSGCAGARVADVSQLAVNAPPPRVIMVEVDTTSTASEDDGTLARSIGAQLGDTLIKRLAEAHLAAARRQPGVVPAGDALLRVDVTLADEGSRLRRLVIGFGAGKARLSATASLDSATGLVLSHFDTASDSGRKPGLILPGGIAAATGSLTQLAIGGGIDVALNLQDGLAGPTRHTAQAIVEQLKSYYAAVGWPWPNAS